jgi:hypothetical protein
MDNIVSYMFGFACGLVLAIAFLACPSHSYDDQESQRRLGEGNWFEFQQQKNQLNDQYMKQKFNDPTKKDPC